MICNIDPLIPYILVKILYNKDYQNEASLLNFHNIMYDLKGQKFNVDDFSEILNYTSTNLYDTFITHLIKTDLIFELRVRILDDNNQFKLDEEGDDDNFLNLHLDIEIDKDFLILNENIFLEFYKNKSNGKNYTDKEKEYFKFVKGHYSQKQNLAKLPTQFHNQSIKENFHIYFIYKPNLQNIKKYLDTYLDKWSSYEFKYVGNHMKPMVQIENFKKILTTSSHNIGDEFEYTIGFYPHLDEVTLILYYQKLGYIQFQLLNGSMRFKIKILQKFLDDFTKKEGISFNQRSGKVLKDGDTLGEIRLGTQQFKFFKFLFENRGIAKTHEEIYKYIKPNEIIANTCSTFCTNVKKDLPKPIKDLIKAPVGKYLIP